MSKKTIIISVFLLGLIIAMFILTSKKSPAPVLPIQKVEKITVSNTFKEYQDPSGFTFSYPDNLTITNNEVTDNVTYSDIQLSSNGVNGSISIKITDSKFKTIDDWLKLNKGDSKETKLGNVKAVEVTTSDRLLLGAIDQGIFFDIEVPLVEKDFWTVVYGKILNSFTFVQPEVVSDVVFEGEEVVE